MHNKHDANLLFSALRLKLKKTSELFIFNKISESNKLTAYIIETKHSNYSTRNK